MGINDRNLAYYAWAPEDMPYIFGVTPEEITQWGLTAISCGLSGSEPAAIPEAWRATMRTRLADAIDAGHTDAPSIGIYLRYRYPQ